MAPFTQAAFIPKQHGYFVGRDAVVEGRKGIVDFMENTVTNVTLNLPLPSSNVNTLISGFKVEEVQILSKSADDQKSIISWSTGSQGFTRSRAHSMFWLPNGWTTENMEQPIVCQNPLCWTSNKDWQHDKNNIAIRLRSNNSFLTDYSAESVLQIAVPAVSFALLA